MASGCSPDSNTLNPPTKPPELVPTPEVFSSPSMHQSTPGGAGPDHHFAGSNRYVPCCTVGGKGRGSAGIADVDNTPRLGVGRSGQGNGSPGGGLVDIEHGAHIYRGCRRADGAAAGQVGDGGGGENHAAIDVEAAVGISSK